MKFTIIVVALFLTATFAQSEEIKTIKNTGTYFLQHLFGLEIELPTDMENSVQILQSEPGLDNFGTGLMNIEVNYWDQESRQMTKTVKSIDLMGSGSRCDGVQKYQELKSISEENPDIFQIAGGVQATGVFYLKRTFQRTSGVYLIGLIDLTKNHCYSVSLVVYDAKELSQRTLDRSTQYITGQIIDLFRLKAAESTIEENYEN